MRIDLTLETLRGCSKTPWLFCSLLEKFFSEHQLVEKPILIYEQKFFTSTD